MKNNTEYTYVWNEDGSSRHTIEDALSIGDDLTGLASPTVVTKTWGYELHYTNSPQYCCKLLHFDEGSTSMHFHVRKHETLVVTKGVLTLQYVYNKETHTIKLQEGEGWIMARGFPHKLIALDGPVDVFEASTQDYPEDSIRIG